MRLLTPSHTPLAVPNTRTPYHSIKQAVLRDATGAPILPERLQASISHKDDVAVCLLRNGDGGACVRPAGGVWRLGFHFMCLP